MDRASYSPELGERAAAAEVLGLRVRLESIPQYLQLVDFPRGS